MALVYHGPALVYFPTPGSVEDRVELRPTERQWRTFWQELDRLDVWSWRECYDNPYVLDGTRWSVEMRHGTRVLHSVGYNAYPPDGSSECGRDFRHFLRAVRGLVGGREIY